MLLVLRSIVWHLKRVTGDVPTHHASTQDGTMPWNTVSQQMMMSPRAVPTQYIERVAREALIGTTDG